MKVLNIHTRTVNQPKEELVKILETLTSKEDRLWPYEHWPRIKFKQGIEVGSKGGHGPIRYAIEQWNPNEIIQFRFLKPTGFQGIHKLEIININKTSTEIRHTIDMVVTGKGIFLWHFAIRWLQDALLEDAFDKVENQYTEVKKRTKWSLLVKILRKALN